MKITVHKIFIYFLILIGVLTSVAILIRNFDYYILPIEERPFHVRYETLKPSGTETHGYGIVGSMMIIFGVAMYSSRKRVHAFKQVGKIKYFLEFHIFLCLVGPILILYHTTFKFGGLVAVSFWSMTAVVLSGIVGRYVYLQIPKGILGNELSIQELDEKNKELYLRLKNEFGLDETDLQSLDSLARPVNEITSIFNLILFFIKSDFTRRSRVNKIIHHLHSKKIEHGLIHSVTVIVKERIQLLQRIYFMEELKNIFHYWHIVHLPFTIIMFVILLIHVAVALSFGYTWIF